MGLSLPKRNRFSDALGAIGRGASRTFDQINPLDNGRTWQQTTPTNNKSAFQQAGQAGGQLARSTFEPIAKTANTGFAALNTANNLRAITQASLLGTDKSYQDTVRNTQNSNNRWISPGSGLLGTGSWFKNKDEATNIGTKDLAGRILGGGAETYLAGKSLQTGGFVGKGLFENGLKTTLQTQLPNAAKTAGINYLQNGVNARNNGASWTDANKAGLIGAGTSTLADVGLGFATAALHPVATSASKSLYSAAKPKVDFQKGPKAFVIKEGVPTTQPLKIKAGVPLANNPLQKPKVGFQVTDNSVPKKLNIVDNSAPRQISGAAQQSMLGKVKSSIKPLKEVGGAQIGDIPGLNKFAKNDKNIVYRSENPNRYGIGQAELGNGLYVGSKETAGRLADGTVDTNGLHSYSVNPTAKILDSSSDTFRSIDSMASNHPSLKGLDGRAWQQQKANIITQEAKKQGFDGVKRGTAQTVVFSDKALTPLSKNAPMYKSNDPLNPSSFAKVFGGTEQQATKVLDTSNPTMEKAVTTIMQKEGLTADKARVKVNKILKESTGTELKDTITPGVPLRVEGNPAKNPQVQEVLQGLSKARGKAGVEGSQVAGSISSKAKELGVPVDQGFIDRFQAGKLTGDEKLLGDHIKSLTDPLFKKQAQLDKSIQYRKNYVPQSYANTADEVASAIKKLQTSTGAAKRREFNTYAEAAQYGLTPKLQSIDQMIGTSAQKAEGALQNRDLIKKGIESGVLSTDPNMGIQVVGLKAPGGAPVFAQKEVADTINGVLQKGTGTLAKTLNKTAEGAGLAQDVMLQGGIPGTNANFFVAGQAVKDTTRNIGKAPFHPIQAIKQEANLVGDFFRGTDATVKRFTQDSFKANGADIPNSTFVRDLANQGLYIQPQTAMSGMTKGTVRKAWDSLGNNPTFGRYMPNRLLSTAQEVYSQTVGDLGHDAAIKLAADTTKTFTGQVDTILKGRSNLANDISSVALFAPKYRESIVNSLTNVVKSVYPSKWDDPTFKPSRELLGGMAATLAGYEALNMKLNGHSMFENRQGQELSLQIPYGQKDEKGNQKVVNVPFMPGFMTIPRAIGSAAVAVKNGDVKGVVAQGSKALSAPLQIIGNVTGNKDYFDRPIYLDQKNADAEGVNPDSAGVASKKVAGYVAGQLSPAWVRGVIDKASGKPTVQALATALEAPVRFGKQVNPDTLAYFKDRDAVYNSLDKNDRAVWDTIHPKLKNVNGEYIVDKSVDSGLARASNYLDRPKVLAAENEMAQRAKARGQKVDPLFDLPGDQQRIALRMDTLPPKDPNKTILRKQNPWYNDFTAQRSAFFDSLPPGDPNKPKGPISYPEASPQTQSLVDAYYQLQDPTQKRNMLTSNPDIADQFAKEEQYSRAVRAAKNLPQYDKYPEPPKDVQNLLDFYTSMPKGEGANGKSPTRSAWIKSHPNEWAKLTDQFSKQAQYSLQQDASLAQFEGQDLTEKGIKSIQSLAKSLGMSTGGGGYGNGGRSDGGFNTASYMNGISTPGGTSRKITIKAPTVAIKAKATKVSRPKVTIKRSKV